MSEAGACHAEMLRRQTSERRERPGIRSRRGRRRRDALQHAIANQQRVGSYLQIPERQRFHASAQPFLLDSRGMEYSARTSLFDAKEVVLTYPLRNPIGPHDGAPWNQLEPGALAALRDLIAVSAHEVPAGRMLEVANGESKVVYFMLSGWFCLSKASPSGDRQIIDFLLPGSVFDPGSAHAIVASTDVSALTDSKVAIIVRDAWLRYLLDHVKAQELVLRLAAASYARLAERLLRLGRGSAETRIAYAICELGLRANLQGIVPGKKFHLPLTQQVLGDFVGLSSVHVSRTISRMVEHGVLSRGDHMDIVVHDLTMLAELAEIDLEELEAAIKPDL